MWICQIDCLPKRHEQVYHHYKPGNSVLTFFLRRQAIHLWFSLTSQHLGTYFGSGRKGERMIFHLPTSHILGLPWWFRQ